MATLQRAQKKQQDLDQLQQLLGIYQQFSPEAKLRESMLGEQVTGARLGNQEQAGTMDLRRQMLQTQLGQQQFGLESAKQMAPEQLRSLQAEIEARMLGNQREAVTLPYAGPMAQAQSQMAGTRAHVAQKTAPHMIEGAALDNAGRKAQISQVPAEIAQRQATTRSIEADTALRQKMSPVQIAGSLAEMQQAMFRPNQPPVIPDEMILSLLGGMGVDMAPAQPQLPQIVQQDLQAVMSGALKPDRFGAVVGSPAPGQMSPRYHAILTAMAANPDAPWPPQYIELYNRLKANPNYNPVGDKF